MRTTSFGTIGFDEQTVSFPEDANCSTCNSLAQCTEKCAGGKFEWGDYPNGGYPNTFALPISTSLIVPPSSSSSASPR